MVVDVNVTMAVLLLHDRDMHLLLNWHRKLWSVSHCLRPPATADELPSRIGHGLRCRMSHGVWLRCNIRHVLRCCTRNFADNALHRGVLEAFHTSLHELGCRIREGTCLLGSLDCIVTMTMAMTIDVSIN